MLQQRHRYTKIPLNAQSRARACRGTGPVDRHGRRPPAPPDGAGPGKGWGASRPAPQATTTGGICGRDAPRPGPLTGIGINRAAAFQSHGGHRGRVHAALGLSERRGDWLISPTHVSLSVLGSTVIDLRHARLSSEETVITAFGVLGRWRSSFRRMYSSSARATASSAPSRSPGIGGCRSPSGACPSTRPWSGSADWACSDRSASGWSPQIRGLSGHCTDFTPVPGGGPCGICPCGIYRPPRSVPAA